MAVLSDDVYDMLSKIFSGGIKINKTGPCPAGTQGWSKPKPDYTITIEEEWDDWFYIDKKIRVVKMPCRYPQSCENCDKPAVWSWRASRILISKSDYEEGFFYKCLCDDCDFKDILINSGALDEEA